jgi:V8-like Glu-specific endopeptidase
MAQPGLSFERAQVLAQYGEVVPRSISLPIGQGIGKVSEANVTHGNTSTLRLHFQVQNAPAQPTWAVVLRDSNNKFVWAYSPAAAGRESDFWSHEVRGHTARVEVYSTEENNPLQLSIDRICVSRPMVKPEAITPPDNRASIRTQSETIRNWGRAVARIRFIADNDGGGYVCTGILVAPDLLLTNDHCPRSDSERKSTLVEFDYDSSNAALTTLRLKETILANAELDFALYRLSDRPANRQPLRLTEITVAENQALLIIQHPAGEPKQVSIIDCRASGAQLDGITTRLTDFGHLCDTLGGSSGSGVLDINSGQVIGLHHLGFNSSSRQLVNRAVHIRLIADYIRGKNKPEILAEMGLRQD